MNWKNGVLIAKSALTALRLNNDVIRGTAARKKVGRPTFLYPSFWKRNLVASAATPKWLCHQACSPLISTGTYNGRLPCPGKRC